MNRVFLFCSNIFDLSQRDQFRRFEQKKMGSQQTINRQELPMVSIDENTQKTCVFEGIDGLSEDFCEQSNINIEFIERNEFKHSSSVTASKDLMVVNHQTSLLKFSCTKHLFLNQQLLKNLVLPLTDRIIKKTKSNSQFQAVKIDFKKFVPINSTPISKKYKILQQIGLGSFGIVYKAQVLGEAGQLRAVKRIQKRSIKQCDASHLMNEIQILKKCDHPNILKIYELYEDQSYYFVVSELCSGGSLLQYINRNNLHQSQIKVIFVQILYALKYLHSLRILHRDMKLQNVLIIEDKSKRQNKIQIKIIDFGLSVCLSPFTTPITDEMAGTLLYMPPESLYGELNLKSDIWSCGIMLYMMLTKHVPYKFKDQEELMNKIEYCRITRKHLKCLNKQAKHLINLMLQCDTNRRYGADRALKAEWLRNTKISEITHSERKRAATQILAYDMKNNLLSIIESYIAFKKVNQLQRQRLASIFAELDKDRSGAIDIREFKAFYAENSQYYDEAEIQNLLKVIDKNKSGFIDFTQFIVAMHNKREAFDFQNLKEVFEFFDTDHSGNISKKEIKLILSGIKNQELDHLFLQLDEDFNEEISTGEFYKYCRTKQY